MQITLFINEHENKTFIFNNEFIKYINRGTGLISEEEVNQSVIVLNDINNLEVKNEIKLIHDYIEDNNNIFSSIKYFHGEETLEFNKEKLHPSMSIKARYIDDMFSIYIYYRS